MIPSKAIELAMAETVDRYGDIGKDTIIRAFRSMDFNGRWKKEPDRQLPFLGFRASPPMTDDSQASQYVDVYIDAATDARDDKSHDTLSYLEEGVQVVLDKLFSGFRDCGATGGTNAEYDFFNSKVAEYTDVIQSEQMSFTWADGQPPAEDSGINRILMVLRVHFGRSDF
jgi:hypothetical protein